MFNAQQVSASSRWAVLIVNSLLALAAFSEHQDELWLKQQAEQQPTSYEINHRAGEFYVQQKKFAAAVVYL